ncbi:MAG: hypothetical protein QM652_13585 [Legionella sp.]|uniref:hypothetical protein n=1 Tax=Legionella sp. TaxID=459 RepID=UPI0039E47E0F
MLIEPVQPIFVVVKVDHNDHMCQMISLSDNQLQLKCSTYFEKESQVSFLGKYFRGRAVIEDISFSKLHFIYQMNIEEIQFQPGLLINTHL